MTCPKCSSRMFPASLNYESNGMDNFSILEETLFFKCPICGTQHFHRGPEKKRSFVAGQKIKGVPVDVD